LLTLDIDDSGLTLNELSYELTMGIEGALVAYSTYSHTADKPKIRVVIPLSKPVSGTEYRALAEKFVAGWSVKCDPCSFKPNQLMYMPRCRVGELGNAWTMKVDGDCLDVDTFLAVSATADKLSVPSTPSATADKSSVGGVSGGVSGGEDFDLVSDTGDGYASVCPGWLVRVFASVWGFGSPVSAMGCQTSEHSRQTGVLARADLSGWMINPLAERIWPPAREV
jgi:hypothetical protein